MSKNQHRTRYSDAELEEFRSIISKKLARAKEQFNFYRQQIKDWADNPDFKIKGLDDGAGVAEYEQLCAMSARQEKLIQHLENAIIRIDNKVYGICRVTGKLIDKDRLRAVPHATLSVEAKSGQ